MMTPMPTDAAAFCEANGLRECFAKMLALAAEHLQPVEAMSAELQHDPETGEQWIALSVPVRGTVEEILERNNALVRAEIAQIPLDKLNKITAFVNFVE